MALESEVQLTKWLAGLTFILAKSSPAGSDDTPPRTPKTAAMPPPANSASRTTGLKEGDGAVGQNGALLSETEAYDQLVSGMAVRRLVAGQAGEAGPTWAQCLLHLAQCRLPWAQRSSHVAQCHAPLSAMLMTFGATPTPFQAQFSDLGPNALCIMSSDSKPFIMCNAIIS